MTFLPPEFQDFISSFKLSRHDLNEECAAVLLFSPSKSGIKDGKPYSAPEIILYVQENSEAKFKSFVKFLDKWILKHGHPSPRNVISAVIALIAYRVETGADADLIFRELDSQFCCADVSHFLILPADVPPHWSKNLEWQGFEMGQTPLKKLEARIRKAGVFWQQFAERSGFLPSERSSLSNKATVASPIYFKTVVLDFSKSAGKDIKHTNNIFDLITTHYFSAMAEFHLEEMWEDFEQKRLIPSALGYRFLDVDAFRTASMLWHFAIYLNFSSGRQGRIHVSNNRKEIELSDLEATEDAINAMEERYNISNLHKSSMFTLLNSVCRTIGKAYSHAGSSRGTKAFLYFIIALEQVFSEKEKTTAAVSGRSAAFLYRQLGFSYAETRKEITEFYNIRSKFVHKGETVPEGVCARGFALPEALVRALMHLCSLEESVSPEFYKSWLKKIDWVVASLEIGMEPSKEVCHKLGILEPESEPLPGGYSWPTLK